MQATAFRLLEQPRLANGMTVAAPTFGQTISEKIRVPRPKGSRFAVPRYDLAEVAATAEYYRGIRGVAAGEERSEQTLRKALFLTNGNAKELRQYAQASTDCRGAQIVAGRRAGHKVASWCAVNGGWARVEGLSWVTRTLLGRHPPA